MRSTWETVMLSLYSLSPLPDLTPFTHANIHALDMSAGRVTVVTAPTVAVSAVAPDFICCAAGIVNDAMLSTGVPLMAGEEPQNL